MSILLVLSTFSCYSVSTYYPKKGCLKKYTFSNNLSLFFLCLFCPQNHLFSHCMQLSNMVYCDLVKKITHPHRRKYS